MILLIMRTEQEEKENQRIKDEMMKEMARREEARASYNQILAEKSLRKKEEKQLELQYAQRMKLKIEKEEKLEKEKQEKRRQEQINNLKYNQEAMRQNVQKRAEGLKLTQLINQLEEIEEKRKAKLIEEERIRMLREHAPKLLGYFPKGCLKKKDLEALGITGNSPLPEPCPLQEQKQLSPS